MADIGEVEMSNIFRELLIKAKSLGHSEELMKQCLQPQTPEGLILYERIYREVYGK